MLLIFRNKISELHNTGLRYRLIQKNYDVVCFMADVGQNEDFAKAKQKAKAIGAKDVSFLDLTQVPKLCV